MKHKFVQIVGFALLIHFVLSSGHAQTDGRTSSKDTQSAEKQNLTHLIESQGHYLTALVMMRVAEKMGETRDQQLMNALFEDPNLTLETFLENPKNKPMKDIFLSSTLEVLTDTDFLLSLGVFLGGSHVATKGLTQVSLSTLKALSVQLAPKLMNTWLRLMGQAGFGMGIAAQDLMLELLASGKYKKTLGGRAFVAFNYFVWDFHTLHQDNKNSVLATGDPSFNFPMHVQESNEHLKLCKGISNDYGLYPHTLKEDAYGFRRIFCSKLQLQLMNFRERTLYFGGRINPLEVATSVALITVMSALAEATLPISSAVGASFLMKTAKFALHSARTAGMLTSVGLVEERLKRWFFPLNDERIEAQKNKLLKEYRLIQEKIAFLKMPVLVEDERLTPNRLKAFEPMIEQEELFLKHFNDEYMRVAQNIVQLSLAAQSQYFALLVKAEKIHRKDDPNDTERKHIETITQSFYNVMQNIPQMNRCGLSHFYEPAVLVGMEKTLKQLACHYKMKKNMDQVLEKIIPEKHENAPSDFYTGTHFLTSELLKDQRTREKLKKQNNPAFQHRQMEVRYPLQMILVDRFVFKKDIVGDLKNWVDRALPRLMMLNQRPQKELLEDACISQEPKTNDRGETLEVPRGSLCYNLLIESILPMLMEQDRLENIRKEFYHL